MRHSGKKKQRKQKRVRVARKSQTVKVEGTNI